MTGHQLKQVRHGIIILLVLIALGTIALFESRKSPTYSRTYTAPPAPAPQQAPPGHPSVINVPDLVINDYSAHFVKTIPPVPNPEGYSMEWDFDQKCFVSIVYQGNQPGPHGLVDPGDPATYFRGTRPSVGAYFKAVQGDHLPLIVRMHFALESHK